MQTNKPPILTVSELTQAIKNHLETAFPLIWLQGEVSNFKLQTSGHLYFSLKDANAQIAAVMFRGDAASLEKMPKSGDQVIVKAEMNVFPPKGNYQLIVRELSQVGLGELLLKLEELKRKLHAKGWFSKAHKKPLPHLPKRIGIVTSPTGAVIQDVLNVLKRRFSSFHLILNPVKVQGEGAAQEIAQAIEQFNRYDLCDVMIVCRGGGSLEDLWAFNEEIVASAIFHSSIPIVCAVGHETDHCIAEYVADLRAPTPSAAAEIVMAEKSQQIQHLQKLEKGIQLALAHQLKHNRQHMKGLVRHPFFTNPYSLLGPYMQLQDDLRNQLDNGIEKIIERNKHRLSIIQHRIHTLKPSNQISYIRQQVQQLDKRITFSLSQKFLHTKQNLSLLRQEANASILRKKDLVKKLFNAEIKRKQLDKIWEKEIISLKERLNKFSTTLKAIDPKILTQRGYSILFSENTNSVINSVYNLKEQDRVTILLCDGKAQATVTQVIPEK